MNEVTIYARHRSMRRPRYTYEDNTKMGLKELIQGSELYRSGSEPCGGLVNTVMNLRLECRKKVIW
jgi:hypothetical protein